MGLFGPNENEIERYQWEVVTRFEQRLQDLARRDAGYQILRTAVTETRAQACSPADWTDRFARVLGQCLQQFRQEAVTLADVRNTDLAQQLLKTQDWHARARQEIEELEAERDRLADRVATLERRAARREEQLAQARAQHAETVEQLQAEIDDLNRIVAEQQRTINELHDE